MTAAASTAAASILDRARTLDEHDPLPSLRERFHVPPGPDGTPSAYLVGNSLGLMPKAARDEVVGELEDWARLGVEGHFHARRPWYPAHEAVRGPLARLVGAMEREVVAMNSLTVNLHLLMASFYRPTRDRHLILIDGPTFPSDSYAVRGQARWHARHAGFDAEHAVLRAMPRQGEHTLRVEDLLRTIDEHRDRLALVLLAGVNYLTGQALPIPAISRFCRERGITIGWDLAHAAGNVPTHLHESGADFAAWCSYKYLNAGPGAIAGAFVHERHLSDPALVRLAGWWGNDPATRFAMTDEFVPVASADAWATSNPPILALAPLRASLALFDVAGIANLRERALRLGAFLRGLLLPMELAGAITVLTPGDSASRGCQVSIALPATTARGVHEALTRAGCVTDYREPGVIRAAPTPLYNTFADIARFVVALASATGFPADRLG